MSKLVVGLTGGVASGKSAVAAYFEALGVPVLDADQVSRDVVTPPSPVLQQIAQTFGADALLPDGTLDRRRMRERIFGDPQAKQQLEALLHPVMGSRMREWIAAQTTPYCILSIAILLETGMRQLVDRVLVVDAPVDAQRERLMARDQISETLADRMIAAQMSREVRRSLADDVLLNQGSLSRAQRDVDALHQQYLALAST